MSAILHQAILASLGNSGGGPSFVFPTIADNNATFEDEGTSTAGWTASNGTLSTSSSFLRLTKTVGSGSAASMTKSLTFTPTNRDFILYGSVRCSKAGAQDTGVIWFLNGSNNFAFWLGTPDASTTFSNTATSGRVNSGLGDNNVNLGTVTNYDTVAIEFAMHFCIKFNQVSFWYKENDGRWKFRGRAAGNFFANTQIQVLKGSLSPTSSWIEIDYLSLCQPNIMAIGDSICAGSTLFNPNRTSGLTNDESTWMRHAPIYPSLRNNLIVNKGVGGESSTTISGRITDVTNQSPRLVYLHASTNDTVASVPKATRTTNIQNSINSISAAGANCILLNAMYGTSTNSLNPGLRDYMLDWWNTDRTGLTSLYASIDIMQPLLSSGFMNASLTQSDNIHPTTAGYALVGGLITSPF